jgi:SpoVK/Ycf46/Vps4 family AAA+-type ATPase
MKVKNISHCYVKGCQYLSDELIRLDLSIHLLVLRLRGKQGDKGVNQMAGLLVNEAGEKDSNRGAAPVQKKLESLQEEISIKVQNSVTNASFLPPRYLVKRFGLSVLELDILLICLAPELDSKYERLYAFLHGDITRKSPTAQLTMDLLQLSPQARDLARACFFPNAPLFKYSLISFPEDDENTPLISRSLKLDNRIVDFLLEHNNKGAIQSCPPVTFINPLDTGFISYLNAVAFQVANFPQGVIFNLIGPQGSGKKRAAEAFCYRQGLTMIHVNLEELLNPGKELNIKKILRQVFLETALQPVAILLEHFDILATGNENRDHARLLNVIANSLKDFPCICFLVGEKPWKPIQAFQSLPYLPIRFPIPSYKLRKQLWQQTLEQVKAGGISLDKSVNIEDLANTFRFTGGQIREVVTQAVTTALLKGSQGKNKDSISMANLYRACRDRSNDKLEEMARKVAPKYSWQDIVLPPDKIQQLKEIHNHVKYRQLVYQEWGFDGKLTMGKGLNILFSGPSGTGKTMAADVIANELHVDYYKIDLANIVSKYIGETEKNLAAIFHEAETANAILFFDEADALFGKRSEVKDAHDRYANIETNYLLQKMEEHKGIVIMATNFRKNIDDAFTRRLHFSLDFPFPDEQNRQMIWRKIFPVEMPKQDIDYKFLGRYFKVSGGSIKNIAINAAFLAAGQDKVVTMAHIAHAARREYQKEGKLCDPSDFGKYYETVVRGSDNGGGRNE